MMTSSRIDWNSDLDKNVKYDKQRLILEGSHDIFSMSWNILQKKAYRTFNQMGINMNLENNISKENMQVVFAKFAKPITQDEIVHLDNVFIQHLRDIKQNQILIHSKCKDPNHFTFYDRMDALKLKTVNNTTEDHSIDQSIEKSMISYITAIPPPNAAPEEKKETDKSYLHLFLTTQYYGGIINDLNTDAQEQKRAI